MDSLKVTDAASAAVAVAPRVSLDDIKAYIAERHDFMAAEVVPDWQDGYKAAPGKHPLDLLSICLLVMRNGFTVVGKSAPASADNFDAALGRQYAYEDAVRQAWPLMGFALRDRITNG